MEGFKTESREILRKYRAGTIDRNACCQALNNAVIATIYKLKPDQLAEFQRALKAAENALSAADIVIRKRHSAEGVSIH